MTGWILAVIATACWIWAEIDRRRERIALQKIASYEGFEDGAIMLSTVAREALRWDDYV